MKKIISFFSLLLVNVCFSQMYHEYYVVEKEFHSIEPATMTANNDGSLNLTFNQQDINDFLIIQD
ncbi:MAG: hypothetical protein H3C39_09485 [Flavobacteriia bacterium]|nr:hypothetical protein [Flavobacteriia bacterium]